MFAALTAGVAAPSGATLPVLTPSSVKEASSTKLNVLPVTI